MSYTNKGLNRGIDKLSFMLTGFLRYRLCRRENFLCPVVKQEFLRQSKIYFYMRIRFLKNIFKSPCFLFWIWKLSIRITILVGLFLIYFYVSWLADGWESWKRLISVSCHLNKESLTVNQIHFADDKLVVSWIKYGIFISILRLHTSSFFEHFLGDIHKLVGYQTSPLIYPLSELKRNAPVPYVVYRRNP